jgi:bacteriochlorophyll 4-vinyl reductase
MVQREEGILVNAVVRQALIASQEVMGDIELNAVLNDAGLGRYIGNFPPDDLNPGISAFDYARFNQVIEQHYGRAGKGILKRIGKASFQYGVNEHPALMGFAGIAMKALPKRTRIRYVLNSIADVLKKTNPPVKAWVGEDRDVVFFAVKTCSICIGRSSDIPVCHLYIGSLTEAIRWVTGEEYYITETACSAMGDEYCRFDIGVRLG